MGNNIKKASSYVNTIVQHVVKLGKDAYSFGDEVLDYISYNICQEKPTLALATQCMDIPAAERDVIEAVLNYAYDILGLVFHPIKLVNDKKFCTHVYQTSFVFSSTGGPMAQQKKMSFCEKMIIYIGTHSTKIVEPANKRMLSNVEIENEEYDIPVDLWYTLKMKNDRKLYFFIHISVTRGYKGILFAADLNNNDLFDEIQQVAEDYYVETLGKHVGKNVSQNGGQVQVIDDIL